MAAITLMPIAAAGAHAQQFIPDIIISSTIPANGDLNPYGVAFVPPNFPKGGIIAPGDILHIPPKIAHQVLLEPGTQITYFTLKVKE